MDKTKLNQEASKWKLVWNASWISLAIILLFQIALYVWINSTSLPVGYRVFLIIVISIGFFAFYSGVVGLIGKGLRRLSVF